LPVAGIFVPACQKKLAAKGTDTQSWTCASFHQFLSPTHFSGGAMTNKMWRVAAGVFVVGLVFDFVLYFVLLNAALARDAVAQRAIEGPWPKLIIGELLFAIAFAWIYVRGVDRRPAVGQGLRFGLAAAFLFAVAGGLQIAPMLPASETIIIGSIVGNGIKVLMQGLAGGVLAGSAPA
jgi:hypothetical protein